MGFSELCRGSSGDGYKRNPQALNDIKTYASNAARWLAQR